MSLDIMIDIDDVIVPWFETVDRRCREAWGDHHAPCVAWDMAGHYGVTRREWEAVVISATLDGLYTTTEPLPGSVEALRRLMWAGHRLHIVTARGFFANGDNIRAWTKDYLNNFAVPHETLTFAKDKVAAQAELGVRFDFAVDDGVHNFEALHAAGVPTYLHTAPHNSTYVAPPGLRVDSLWEFANIILNRAQEAS